MISVFLWGYNVLVSTACPLWWKKNIIYVCNVYNKSIKNITFIIVMPGSTIREAMKQDSTYSKLPF